jgi:hypothetical protein
LCPSSIRDHGSGCSWSLPPLYPHPGGGCRVTPILAARFSLDVLTFSYVIVTPLYGHHAPKYIVFYFNSRGNFL